MTFLEGDDPQHFIVIFRTVVTSSFTFELNLLSNNFGTKFYFYLPSTEPKVHEDFCCSNASSMTISPFALADRYGRINRTDGSSPSLGPTYPAPASSTRDTVTLCSNWLPQSNPFLPS